MNIKNVNPNKLVDELQFKGIKMLEVSNNKKESEYIAENTWIEFAEDTDMELVQQTIDAHDPTPLPEQPTENEVLRDYILEVDYRLIIIELGL